MSQPYRDAVRWAVTIPNLTPPQRLCLMILAWRARQPFNTAWPSVRGLARDTGLARRTVQRALRVLERRDLIDPIGEGGAHEQTVYRLAGVGVLADGKWSLQTWCPDSRRFVWSKDLGGVTLTRGGASQ